MLKIFKRVSLILCAVALLTVIAVPSVKSVAYATNNEQAEAATYAENEVVNPAETETSATENRDNSKGSKAIAAGICVGLAAALGALAMGIAIAKSNEAIARQPEATSQIKSGLMLGLVFIETAIIYALIVAILVIFVL